MALTVRPLLSEDEQQWDELVLQHPYGSPFHLMAWKKSIEETFRYQPYYLVAAQGSNLRGVLPLFLVQNFLMGKALISSPFAVYGGILADSEAVREAFRERVKALGEALQVDYVELRNAHSGQAAGFTAVSRYVTFTQPIGPEESAILEGIPRKTRYMVRKGLKSGCETRRQATNFLAFEALYSENLRRLGTPSFPPRHFARLIANFGDAIDIREVVLEGDVVAAVMSLYFRDTVLPYYGAADVRYNDRAVSNFMYFDLMRSAGKDGYRTFDFGRSKKESGSFDFKAHWGMEVRDLPYEMLLVKRKDLPHYSPNNPRFRAAIKLWQNLPLPLTRALGPPLVRLVP
jgi:FemAB-related protein (PEP-CTERM system-associated)